MRQSPRNSSEMVLKDRSVGLAVCVMIMIVPVYVSLALRFCVRRSKKTLSVDDWCMLPAAFLLTGCSIISIAGALAGVGIHDENLTNDDKNHALMWWNLFLLFYCSAMISIKLSVAFTLCRIASNRRWCLYGLYGAMTLFTIVAIACIIYLFVHCRPYTYGWDKSIKGGYCLPKVNITNLGFTLIISSILTD